HAVLVEANPAQARIIRETYPRATLHEFAACEVDGEAEFEVYKGNEGDVGSSSLNVGWKAGDGLESDIITVPTKRLEPFITGAVDIMKIDVEGKSLEVLEGLGEALRQIKVLHIETEEWSKSDVAVARYMLEKGY